VTFAGVCALAASVTLLVSGICLGVFFASETEAWGRANDATTSLFAILMIPAVLEIHDRYASGSSWPVQPATVLGIIGLLVIAVTSGMTAAAKLDWLVSAKIGGGGFAGFLAWIGGACSLILAHGGLPVALAWFGLVTLAIVLLVGVLAIITIRRQGGLFDDGHLHGGAMMLAFGLAFLCFPVWTGWLGISL